MQTKRQHTDSKFRLVVFFGKVVAITKNQFPTPDVQSGSNHKISTRVEIFVNCSSLKAQEVTSLKHDDVTIHAAIFPQLKKAKLTLIHCDVTKK